MNEIYLKSRYTNKIITLEEYFDLDMDSQWSYELIDEFEYEESFKEEPESNNGVSIQ